MTSFTISPNNLRVITSRRVSWRDVVCMLKRSIACRILLRKLEGSDHLEDLGIVGKKY
jgi:hypothetical protein